MIRVVFILFVLAFPQSARAADPVPADVIWRNGNIRTLDADDRLAQAIACKDGRITFVGADLESVASIGARTRVIDLQGKTVLPGLIDAHGHLINLGRFGLGLMDLSGAMSFEDVVGAAREKAQSSKPGEWILGGRWDHESWPSKVLPVHDALSHATPRNPVWLRRVDGHAGVANAEAMRLAGVTRETADPPGGSILRDSRGEPTGVFVDQAMSLIDAVAPTDKSSTRELILKGQEMCIQAGLTGVHEPGVSPQEIAQYQALDREGLLSVRMYLMVSSPYALRYFSEHEPSIGEHVTVRATKCYMDGAMGSRGAWLLAPYDDRPTGADGAPYTGLSVTEPAAIFDIAEHALEHGYQVCTHAIGDRANRETLDAYARALARSPRADHRFRIEHAQLLAPADVPRFAKLGVIASMQPTHCTSDMRWVEARVGADRARGAYAWRSLLDAGAHLAGGSDFPVESHNPFFGVYAAATRQDRGGHPEQGWFPDQRLSRDEAVRLFTIWAAFAAFEEDEKGTLEVGKFADFIVLDRDVLLCAPREILDTQVLRTVIGGQTVYERW